MRCPTGVLNGFPIKNSMMSAVRGPAKHRRLRAEPYATASGPAVSLSLSVSLLQTAAASHNKVGHQLNCVMRFKGKAARSYQMVSVPVLVQRNCATHRHYSLLHALLPLY